MELTDSLKSLLIETAASLKGHHRRLFIARTVKQLGLGGQRRAERELGWNRVTIRKDTHELESGFICLDAFAARGRKRAEDHQSASALERHRELRGEAMTFHKAYRYLQTRTQWMRYHLYKRQKLPLGSGITAAGCKIVFRQRLKRSGMSWTIEGGQTILDLRVIKLSQVWNTVYQR